MPRFIHKPTKIEANRMHYSGSMETPQGVVEWDAGDWLIRGVNDTVYPIKHQTFVQSYSPDDDEAEAYLKEARDR